MKTEKYHLALAIMVGILCVPAWAEMEPPLTKYEPLLIAQPNPALTGIEKLYVVIVSADAEPNEDALACKELETKVEQKLEAGGIDINQIRDGRRDFHIPELTVDIDMLKLEDSRRYIFRVQTSLARAVYLAKDSSWSIKADVWKTKPVMQAASVQDTPPAVTNLVLQQVEAFIFAYRVANSQPDRSADANDTSAALVTMSRPAVEQVTAEYEYVASKNSNVFHKPDCRWAKKISPKNLVGYDTKDEAIKAGKRPCRGCKP